jgi:hypothetical protein
VILCKSCNQQKEKTQFYFRPNNGIFSYQCKGCLSTKQKERYERNKEAILAVTAKWKESNRERHIATSARWNKENRERRRAITARYRERNREELRRLSAEYFRKNRADYKARKLAWLERTRHAKPAWANDFFISEIYDLASARTKSLGVVHHVDHIVPLKSKLVCGLHVEANLRVIPGSENIRKNNRWWPDMPGGR